ncbi:retrovirus-related Pol polyprotein from transposon TNT 1-94 [Trichonephila clavata]|uniref:Retrovirus-related Pol polyprotein from transposon TNT 1-94 n=1 Tax=Trichonephila clavata TaxID=2740835 RepID=A0A8X6FXY9_TRICU|nr:retrovirus-related Pol polyprotein from transposon TNT 1-94 [Trichonephila clavata]
MINSNPVSTPIEKGTVTTNNSVSLSADVPSREAVGSLMFLAIVTRPDIADAVGVLSQVFDKPQQIHWTMEKRIPSNIQAAKEAIWLNNLLEELCCGTSVPSLQMDNQSAIRLVKNPEFHNRTKYFDIRCKFIREQYKNKQLNVINCSSEVQAADILAKTLAEDRFLKLKLMLGMYKFGN